MNAIKACVFVLCFATAAHAALEFEPGGSKLQSMVNAGIATGSPTSAGPSSGMRGASGRTTNGGSVAAGNASVRVSGSPRGRQSERGR